jgi:hypothetical protein
LALQVGCEIRSRWFNKRWRLNVLHLELENKILPQTEDLVRALRDLTAY